MCKMNYKFFDEIHQEQNVINYTDNNGDELFLIIRGGSLSYSTPRGEVLPEEYKEMEVAVVKDGKFQSLKDILNTDEYEEYLGGYFTPNSGTGPYGFVPVNLVEKIFLAMEEKYKRNVV